MKKYKRLIKRIQREAYITGTADCRLYVGEQVSREQFDQAFEAGINQRETDLATGSFPEVATQAARARALRSIGVDVLS